MSLAKKAAIPLVANHIARRATALPNSADTLSAVTRLLETSSGEIQAEILRGTLIGLQGRRTVPMPGKMASLLRQTPQQSRRRGC